MPDLPYQDIGHNILFVHVGIQNRCDLENMTCKIMGNRDDGERPSPTQQTAISVQVTGLYLVFKGISEMVTQNCENDLVKYCANIYRTIN